MGQLIYHPYGFSMILSGKSLTLIKGLFSIHHTIITLYRINIR